MNVTTGTARFPPWPVLLLPALSLSIGWGIRGNFGHEHGAMIPGALAAAAGVLVLSREDWHRRVAFFALFGAVGWAFGGSMSYGHVLGYTHSGDPPNILYGFACLYIIGFLWGAMGGAGTALPAYLTRERLTGLLPPALWFFGVLIVHDLTYEPLNAWLAQVKGLRMPGTAEFRHEEPLYWYDADWTTALIGVFVPLLYRLVRRRRDPATGLILHIAVGWWVGFLLFPVLLHWRMTPPRGDNWAGCVGAVAGTWVYLKRNGLRGVLYASLIAGFVGGIGFSLATAIQILWLKTGWTTNWHSVLEQTYGFINGIGVGLAMWHAARIAPPVSDDPPVRRWADWFAPAAVLLLISYLNARKNVDTWVEAKAVAPSLYWFSTMTWFNLGSAAISLAVLYVLIRHVRRPVPLIPATWAGKGQALYLVFLATAVVFNFERAIVSFADQRLITEGVILLNACVCLVLVVCWTSAVAVRPVEDSATALKELPLRRVSLMGSAAAIACCLVCLGLTLAAFGTKPPPFRRPQMRFGPRATAYERPAPGLPHP